MNAFKSPTNKVFDVSHPGSIPANPSSKPVIVSNRPEIEDPMVAGQDDSLKEDINTPEPTDTSSIKATNTTDADNSGESNGIGEDVSESVGHDESVEVKEVESGEASSAPDQTVSTQSSPHAKNSKKTNLFIVILLLLLIIGFTVHALINLGYIHLVNTSIHY